MRAWFSEKPIQQLGFFSLFIARELRIEDVSISGLESSSKLYNEGLETKTPAIGININPLYSNDSFMSIFFKNTENSNEMAHNAAFYQCLH